MAIAAKLQLRQSQSLVMTPQLMQSIKLLQLTHVELQAFIEQEIERNPLLERVDETEPGESDAVGEPLAEAPDAQDWMDGRDLPSASAVSEVMDTAAENVFPEDFGAPGQTSSDLTNWKLSGSGRAGELGDDFDLDDIAQQQLSLTDQIGGQIALAGLGPDAAAVAWDLCYSLDEAGYLRVDAGEVAERLGVEPDLVDSVLHTCQGFDPVGLFARDLAECLALQLKAVDRFDPAMATLVDNLELLARRDFTTLRGLCGVDQADLNDMIGEIRALDPRPGLRFSSVASEAVTPDVTVRAAPDGSWLVELNAAALPRVLVDQNYYALVSAKAGKDDREFLSDCLQNANWLARSLDQRARTILKVASEIVRQQDGFFVHGVRHLRPMNLKTIAEAIGMHESTISRVTTQKFMTTPRGVFEFRYFFTAAIQSADGGDAHSSEAVRNRIRSLIESEGDNVLSDDDIVDALKTDGVDIARRTVAKYREAMNILSSVQRRRERRAMAAA